MEKLKIYSVADQYIDYLRKDDNLKNLVLDHKLMDRKHNRKYLGIVFNINEYNYFVPFASPKDSDYININGIRQIRKDTVSILRMTIEDPKHNETILLGTLKLNNMIPIPASELRYYEINHENDLKYRDVVIKEYEYIKHNSDLIKKNAAFLYHQKEIENSIKNKPGYLKYTVPFKYAENKCLEYADIHKLVKPTIFDLESWQDKAEAVIEAEKRKNDREI